MNLKELLKKFCPNGVEYKKIGELVDYIQPTKYIVELKKDQRLKQYEKNKYEIPVLTPGLTFILGYTDQTNGVYNATKNTPVMIFDDFTTAFRWIDFNFKVKSSAIKILVLKDKHLPNYCFRFIYYVMQTIKLDTRDHQRYWISKYSQLEIPFPPLEVQEKIVNFLNLFAELNTELNTEYTKRKKQYEWYLNSFFDSEFLTAYFGFCNSQTYSILEVSDFVRGLTFNKYDVIYKQNSEINEDKIGVLRSNNIDLDTGTLNLTDVKQVYKDVVNNKNKYLFKEDILMCIANGSEEHIGKSCYISQDLNFVFGGFMGVLRANKNIILPKYLFYLINTKFFKDYLQRTICISTINNINLTILNNFYFNCPPLKIQQKIVNILDKFNTLTNDLNTGLPKEIKLDNKRYAYYRNKILSFDKLEETNK